ncbi:RNA polymerase sigma factor [Pseudomonas sp. ABC1]|uniref:RNA polymerase sigma factor n=1 Tax=Pseudomonas sp. ABC1 TaxID=2748080 RepID=UPI0015C35472|nr:RNA polymerase sigma factor [Pseudomonas sp. ABC1]QLF93830.1 RNA polymerase sigma factor [Pseudomonas sp. ABC1]
MSVPSEERLHLFLRHRCELINYANALLHSRETAEDLVQEAWLKFERHSLEEVQQPTGYLFRMVRNLALDHLRSQQTEQRWLCPLENAEDAVSDAPDPASAAQQSSSLERLESVLDTLDADARTAFEMHRFGGYTLQQIASHLGISSSSAHRLVHSTLQRCLHALKEHG